MDEAPPKRSVCVRLYLAQHGEALPKEIDPNRPLSDKGHSSVKGLAALLGRARVEVAKVVHSGKTRAKQTAELKGSRRADHWPQFRHNYATAAPREFGLEAA